MFRKYVCAREETLIKNWDTIQNYTDILRKIRSFADRNKAVIICKRRARDGKLKKCEKECFGISV